VLDVERRPDVDAGGDELVDVLPALGVARSRDVRVRELVDEDQCGLARQGGVEIEPCSPLALIDCEPGFEALQQRRGVGAAVRLDDSGDDVRAPLLARRAAASIAKVLPTPAAEPK
jgi:hypothetical protein